MGVGNEGFSRPLIPRKKRPGCFQPRPLLPPVTQPMPDTRPDSRTLNRTWSKAWPRRLGRDGLKTSLGDDGFRGLGLAIGYRSDRAADFQQAGHERRRAAG